MSCSIEYDSTTLKGKVMKSTRLTKDIRQKIWDKIREERFGKVEIEHREKLKSLALKCYNAMYSKEERQWMKNAYKGALPEENELFVRFNGKSIILHLEEYKPIFNNHSNSSKCQFEKTHSLTKEFREIHEYKNSKDEEKIRAREATMSILNSFTTTRKLLEIWPEVEPYLNKVVENQKSNNLPAVQVKDINKILGL